MKRYTLVCDDERAQEIGRIAKEYGLTEGEVLDQLVAIGLESVEDPETPLRI
ncbi:CopG family transcriptional regulator [Natronomonas sp. EA1]|uniref:CopG family transcriptional regulator n=1 Tax=Natronomonas sp. EA1 TaxID=3421655 RepID=UPI003EC14B2E